MYILGDCRRHVLSRAEQLREAGIHLRIFLLPSRRPDCSTTFWKEVNERARISEDVDDFDDDVLMRLENFFDSVRRRVHPKRSLGSAKLTIIKDLSCAVKFYALVRPATKGKVVKVDSQTNSEVVPSTAYLCNDTGAKMDAIEHFSFAPERTDGERYPLFVMSLEDVQKAKAHEAETGLVILSFRPISVLREYHQMGPPVFVYPDEHALKGSTTTFIALHENMREAETLAVCQYRRTATTELRFAVLLPQQEVLDSDGRQVSPPGMHLLQLPFMDDIRYPERDPSVVGKEFERANADQVTAADALVEALTLPEDFSTTDISNPHLQRHFEAIEAMALGVDVPDLADFVDDSAPDAEWIAESAEIVKAFERATHGDDSDVGKSSRKKRKVEDPEDARSFVVKTDWASLNENDELSTLTIDKLKKYLEFHHLPLSGRKADLIDRIKDDLAAE